jgi:predicted restriction endonuclease
LKSVDPTKAKDTSGESVLHLEYDDFFPDASKSEPILRDAPSGPSETVRLQKSRRLQSFFRDSVLISYEHRCAITGLEIPVLLVAGHIIPWSVDETRRADPRNGICLNVLHDKMFDRGLITFDKDWRLVISPVLRTVDHPSFHKQALLDFEGARLVLPTRFQPDPEAMRYHRENIFKSGNQN